MDKSVILTQTPISELLEHFSEIVEQKIEIALKKQLEEKLLSPNKVCTLFDPAISRPTLTKLTKQGILKKYYSGEKPVYKYSEVIESLKTYKRYKQNFSKNYNGF